MLMATQECKYHFDKLKIQISFNFLLLLFFYILDCVSLNFFSFIGLFYSIASKVTKFEEE